MTCGKENIVIVTLGNELRGDDNAGLIFGKLLKQYTSYTVFEGGDAPENITGLIVRSCPDIIIIADAMNFDGKPGEMRLVSSEELQSAGFSTHASLKLFVTYLKNITGASILILGIQPKSIELGKNISPEVEKYLKNTVRNLCKNNTLLHSLGFEKMVK